MGKLMSVKGRQAILHSQTSLPLPDKPYTLSNREWAMDWFIYEKATLTQWYYIIVYTALMFKSSGFL